MAQKPRLWCATCQRPMVQVAHSLPQGEARCHPCRRQDQDYRFKQSDFDWRQPRDCKTCGASFVPRIKKQQVCSRKCHVRVRPSRRCETCAREFSPNVDGQRRCSRTCNPEKTAVNWRACPLRLHYFTRQGGQRCTCERVQRQVRAIVRCCIDCNLQYEREPLDGKSERCPTCRATWNADQVRIAKDRRRARKRDAYVADVYRAKVYARDKYRCKLCGKALKMDAVVPHPRAAVLDHIIPLAVGGTHEPANVQAAHFLCNSQKSHRGGGEQLLLIG